METPLVEFGTGVTFFEEAAQAVKDIGFSGWIVSENMYFQPALKRDGDCVEAAKRDVAALRGVYGVD